MNEQQNEWNHKLGPITVQVSLLLGHKHVLTHAFRTVAAAARFIEPFINAPGLSEPDQYAWEIHGLDMRALYEMLAAGASAEMATEAG